MHLPRRPDRDEIRSANLALISGRQMHRINACIFLVAITKTSNKPDLRRFATRSMPYYIYLFSKSQTKFFTVIP